MPTSRRDGATASRHGTVYAQNRSRSVTSRCRQPSSGSITSTALEEHRRCRAATGTRPSDTTHKRGRHDGLTAWRLAVIMFMEPSNSGSVAVLKSPAAWSQVWGSAQPPRRSLRRTAPSHFPPLTIQLPGAPPLNAAFRRGTALSPSRPDLSVRSQPIPRGKRAWSRLASRGDPTTR